MSVVLEYAVVLGRKDRWVSDVMVVIIVTDQGGVVVVELLCCKARGKAGRITTKNALQSGSVCVSLCQSC